MYTPHSPMFVRPSVRIVHKGYYTQNGLTMINLLSQRDRMAVQTTVTKVKHSVQVYKCTVFQHSTISVHVATSYVSFDH